MRNGSKIAIIGAGPAGTFFVDVSAQIAQSKGLNVQIVLFDGKDFTQKGIKGCNLCAGVISETLETQLKARGIVLPEQKVQSKIEGYSLQGKMDGVFLRNPEKKSRIMTVFRGNGPRLSAETGNVSFDDYLLEHIQRQESQVIRKLVKRIELADNRTDPARVIYTAGNKEQVFVADLVVGAFGLAENMMNKVQALNFGYRPPQTVRARNMEIRLPQSFIQDRFGRNIFTYNLTTAKETSVASIIPKRDHITVNMIGKREVKRDDLMRFVDFLAVRGILPENWTMTDTVCVCSPRIATTSAKRPFTNRLVIIGDASCSRYYKNGIESAFVTAKLAAEAAFNYGISESALQKGYYRRIKRLIVRDNFYGRILFKINDLASGSTFLFSVMLELVRREDRTTKQSRMQSVLWNTYTGNIPYKTILIKFINPILQWNLINTTVRLLFKALVTKLSVAAPGGQKKEHAK